ncbi:MAG TPA: hypothetical protein VNI02_23400 [Blastocatellia bacterium]|nr:hypothetical protein [Blastocatellia bacterium]
MADAAIVQADGRTFRQIEFYIFSIISFAGKSWLLLRLPYRFWYVNAIYTGLLLLFFYCYFRFRQNITAPPAVLFFLAAAVAVDVLGNYLGLYGHLLGPVQYDEFAHFLGSGFSLVPAMWLLRAGTRRMGFNLPLALVAFLSVTMTFSYCGYYEILELWDEKYFEMNRIHGEFDTPNDLQCDLAGIVVFALMSSLICKLVDRSPAPTRR